MIKKSSRSAPNPSAQDFNDFFDQSGVGRYFAQTRRRRTDLSDGGLEGDLLLAYQITSEPIFLRAMYLADEYGFSGKTSRRRLRKLYEALEIKEIEQGIDQELQSQRNRGERESFRAAARAYAIQRMRAQELTAHSAEALRKDLERRYKAAKQRACEVEESLGLCSYPRVLVAPLRFPLLDELRVLRAKCFDTRLKKAKNEAHLAEILQECDAVHLELQKLEGQVASSVRQAVLLDGFWVANNRPVREAIYTGKVLLLEEADTLMGPSPAFDLFFYMELQRLANGSLVEYEAFVAAIRTFEAAD
jgi:hypothetical protein